MSCDHLLIERQGPTTTITMNRPEKRNALSFEVMAEVTRAFDEVGRTDTLAIVLAANGKVFSAGHNFGDMAGTDLRAARALFAQCTEMMNTVQAVPQPVIARVHALATAAGCQLVATCDLAIAATSAGFALPGGKGGLFCHTPLVAVARNISRKRALEMALSGDVIDATTAADWGLVNRAVPDDQLDAEVAAMVERVTKGSAYGKGTGKQAFYRQVELEQRQAYDLAGEYMASLAMTDDAQEGFSAFLEKRHPKFSSTP